MKTVEATVHTPLNGTGLRCKMLLRKMASQKKETMMQSVQTKQKPYVKWFVAVAVGALTGILTVYGKFLPDGWNALADSAALWMVIAFFVAATGKTVQTCIGLAAVLLAVANTVYYPLSAVVNKQPIAFGSAMVVWYTGAVLAGIVFGVAAFFWQGKKGLLYYIGGAMPVAVLWAESAMMLTTVYYAQHPLPAYIGFAVGFAVLIGSNLFAINIKTFENTTLVRALLGCMVAAIPITVLGVLGYKVLWWLLG